MIKKAWTLSEETRVLILWCTWQSRTKPSVGLYLSFPVLAPRFCLLRLLCCILESFLKHKSKYITSLLKTLQSYLVNIGIKSWSEPCPSIFPLIHSSWLALWSLTLWGSCLMFVCLEPRVQGPPAVGCILSVRCQLKSHLFRDVLLDFPQENSHPSFIHWSLSYNKTFLCKTYHYWKSHLFHYLCPYILWESLP